MIPGHVNISFLLYQPIMERKKTVEVIGTSKIPFIRNKDLKVSDGFHFIGPKIQVKHVDHLFSIYIKSMGKDTVYRIEERKHPHKSPIDVINDVLNPIVSNKFEYFIFPKAI